MDFRKKNNHSSQRNTWIASIPGCVGLLRVGPYFASFSWMFKMLRGKHHGLQKLLPATGIIWALRASVAQRVQNLVGRRFAHQRFADSRESIRRKIPIFEALRQIRANHVFSLIRIEIRVIRVQSSLLSHFLEGRFAKTRFFFRRENRFAENIRNSSANHESIRANRPTKVRNNSPKSCQNSAKLLN